MQDLQAELDYERDNHNRTHEALLVWQQKYFDLREAYEKLSEEHDKLIAETE